MTDASGGVSTEAHERAVLRMTNAGAVPTTWLAVCAELQRDWAREETAGAIVEIAADHGGVVGMDIGLEMQLLERSSSE